MSMTSGLGEVITHHYRNITAPGVVADPGQRLLVAPESLSEMLLQMAVARIGRVRRGLIEDAKLAIRQERARALGLAIRDAREDDWAFLFQCSYEATEKFLKAVQNHMSVANYASYIAENAVTNRHLSLSEVACSQNLRLSACHTGTKHHKPPYKGMDGTRLVHDTHTAVVDRLEMANLLRRESGATKEAQRYPYARLRRNLTIIRDIAYDVRDGEAICDVNAKGDITYIEPSPELWYERIREPLNEVFQQVLLSPPVAEWISEKDQKSLSVPNAASVKKAAKTEVKQEDRIALQLNGKGDAPKKKKKK